MPNLARYLFLAGAWTALIACVAILVSQTRERQRKAKDELIARRLAGFSASLNPGER